MKSKFHFTTLFAILLIAAACTKQRDELDPSQEKITMHFQIEGEIHTEDVSFANGRTMADSAYTIYAIQVNTITSNESSQPYAYGIFDQLDDLSISVINGNQYQAQATAFRKGTGYGLATYYSNNQIYLQAPLYKALENRFNYSNTDNIQPNDSWTQVFTSADSSNTSYHTRPEISRYISDKEPFNGQDSTTVYLDLIRANFGVQLLADSLNEGKIILQLQNAPTIVLSAPDSESSTHILQFNNLYTIQYNPENYQENIYTTIFHQQIVNGDTISNPLYDNDITFKRNFIKKIFVNVPSGGGSGGAESAFDITLEDVDMQYDSLYVGG